MASDLAAIEARTLSQIEAATSEALSLIHI